MGYFFVCLFVYLNDFCMSLKVLEYIVIVIDEMVNSKVHRFQICERLSVS